MKRLWWFAIVGAGALAFAAGCSSQVRGGGGFSDDEDGGGGDGSHGPSGEVDLSLGLPNECGGFSPGCASTSFAPPDLPFPLSGDPQPDPNVTDHGVDRDPNGYIVLGATHAMFDFIYTANTDDWNAGTVSKINSKTVREVARYMSVTCFSNDGDGSRAPCDGTKGCCSRDDHQAFVNRGQGKPSGPHQAVQTTTNYPSRTAVDFNGDVWVANRAFGGQSSVTKIANDLASCKDRNGTPGIQTSSDVNDDGIIDTDCNRNGRPDDVADVKGKPCNNGMRQEFYGLDDDCLLFTTNTNTFDQYGRPLALGRGAVDFGPADAWAGGFNNGLFFRVDGISGKIKSQGKVQGNPYGAVVDAKGILWAPGGGGGFLAWMDTNNPAANGLARLPNPYGSYGIAIDRDQNVWVGGYPTPHGYRYTPDRSNGTMNLGKGFWTIYQNVGVQSGANGCQGRGIAADSRTPQQYWVWMACHGAPFIVRMDGSVPVPMGADKIIDASGYPAIRVGGSTICGAGVDVQQNVWAVASGGAIATRIKVDMMGNPTTPMLNGAAGNGCPVGNPGDYCGTAMNGVDASTTSYTYSDFTGFGLRNFTNPSGSWAYVMKGCTEQGQAVPGKFMRIAWESDVPPNTTLTVRARTGDVPQPDMTWGNWTGSFAMTPGIFDGVLGPNPAKYIQIEFNLATMDKTTSPKLKSFKVAYECEKPPG